jgi:hypothetical protein
VSAKLAFLIHKSWFESKDFHETRGIFMREVLITFQNGYAFNRNNFMFQLADEVVRDLIPTGIIDQSYAYHKWFQTMQEDPETRESALLTMDDISFGFVIWLIACSVSLTVFISEYAPRKAKIWFGILFAWYHILKHLCRLRKVVSRSRV